MTPPLTSVLLRLDLGLQVFGVDILVVFVVVGWFTFPTAETTAAATAAAGEQCTAHDQTLQEKTRNTTLKTKTQQTTGHNTTVFRLYLS